MNRIRFFSAKILYNGEENGVRGCLRPDLGRKEKHNKEIFSMRKPKVAMHASTIAVTGRKAYVKVAATAKGRYCFHNFTTN